MAMTGGVLQGRCWLDGHWSWGHWEKMLLFCNCSVKLAVRLIRLYIGFGVHMEDSEDSVDAIFAC